MVHDPRKEINAIKTLASIFDKIDGLPILFQRSASAPLINNTLYKMARALNITLDLCLGYKKPRPRTDAVRVISKKYKFIYVGVPLCGTRTVLQIFVRQPFLDFAAFERT